MDNSDKDDKKLNNLEETSALLNPQENEDSPEESASGNSNERTIGESEDLSIAHNEAERNLEESDPSNEVESSVEVSTPSSNELETDSSNIGTTDSTAECTDPCSESTSGTQRTVGLNAHPPLPLGTVRNVRFNNARLYFEIVEDSDEKAPTRSERHSFWFIELPEDLSIFERGWVRSNRRFNLNGEEYNTLLCERLYNYLIYRSNLFAGNTVCRLDMTLRGIYQGSCFDVCPPSKFGQKLIILLSWFANVWGSVGSSIYPRLRRNILVAGGVHQFSQIYREIEVNRDSRHFFYPGKLEERDGTCEKEDEEHFKKKLKESSFQDAYQLPIVTVTSMSRSVQSSEIHSRGCLKAPVRETSSSRGYLPISSTVLREPSTSSSMPLMLENLPSCSSMTTAEELLNANLPCAEQIRLATYLSMVSPSSSTTSSSRSSSSVSLREVDGPELERVSLLTLNISEARNEGVSYEPSVEDSENVDAVREQRDNSDNDDNNDI